VLLIHPIQGRTCLPELTEALRRTGVELQQIFMTDDYSALLDALEGNVLPVVVKG
jgi:hypothetical protein